MVIGFAVVETKSGWLQVVRIENGNVTHAAPITGADSDNLDIETISDDSFDCEVDAVEPVALDEFAKRVFKVSRMIG